MFVVQHCARTPGTGHVGNLERFGLLADNIGLNILQVYRNETTSPFVGVVRR